MVKNLIELKFLKLLDHHKNSFFINIKKHVNQTPVANISINIIYPNEACIRLKKMRISWIVSCVVYSSRFHYSHLNVSVSNFPNGLFINLKQVACEDDLGENVLPLTRGTRFT